MPPYAERKIRLAAATPSQSAFVRITETKKSVNTSGASDAITTTTDDRRASDRAAAADRRHAGLPNRPSGRTASTPTSSANVSRIE